jgi:ribonuclease Z
MRRAILWTLGVSVALVLLAMGALRLPAVEDRVMAAAVQRLITERPDFLFGDDSLRALLCGTSSPPPHPTRAKACVAVFAAGRFWIVDTGPGSWNRMALLRVDPSRIGGVMFTHFHSDHIGDLGEFNLNTWVQGRNAPLRVFGPPGVERVTAGFAEAYALDTGYRVAHHGSDFIPPEFARYATETISGPAETGAPTAFYDQDGLRITAFSVHHDPVTPAYGYRFDYKGRSVTVSGDTAKSDSLIAAAKGTDVLIHEAQANHLVALIGETATKNNLPRVAKIMADIPSYHTSPVAAAEVANAAGAKLLVLYHLTPSPQFSLMERVFVRGVSDVRPDRWFIADDGTLIELPGGSDEIKVSRLR